MPCGDPNEGRRQHLHLPERPDLEAALGQAPSRHNPFSGSVVRIGSPPFRPWLVSAVAGSQSQSVLLAVVPFASRAKGSSVLRGLALLPLLVLCLFLLLGLA